MALATVADVEQRLGTANASLATADEDYTDGLLDEASDLVIAYLGNDPSEDGGTIPGAVKRVTSRMVSRVLKRDANVPEGADSVTANVGPFGQTIGFKSGSTSGAPWLTAVDKRILAPHRTGGGMVGVQMTSGRTGRYRREV